MNTKTFPISPGQSVLVSACVAFVAFILLHLRFAPAVAGSFSSDADGAPVVPNSLVFAVTGAAFLILTFFAHAWTVRGLSPALKEEQASNRRSASGPAILLIPMSIRFVGTFVILGSLLVFGVVGRHEAVFDILFWYVTLTTLEVVGIVWAFRSMRTNETSSLRSRPDAV